MLIKNLPSFSIVLFLFIFSIGCNPSIEESSQDTTYSYESEKIPIQSDQIVDIDEQFIVQEEITEEKTKPTKRLKKANKEQPKFRITPEQLDSINKIVTVFDSIKYDGITINYFTNLSSKLGGKPYYIENAYQINGTIKEILSTRLNDQTDIVLLIDKTGSMDDDWDVVKKSLNEIMNFLSNYHNVRLGIASYGDKNYHLDFWYNMEDLSYDISKLQTFMDTYSTIGNPDTRESVNDAIVKTVNSMSWNPESNRLMIIIGDAPSQLPPLSDYSMEDVISICKSQNVLFNLYPVVISSFRGDFKDTPYRTDIAKVYPNPASDFIKIETSVTNGLSYEIINLTGKTLQSGQLYSKNETITISYLPSGTYLLHVFNQDLTNYHSSTFIKR